MVEKIDLDEVKHTLAQANQITTSVSPNKLVKDQAQQLEKNGSSDLDSAVAETNCSPVYGSDSFLNSFNNLFKALLSPKDVGSHSKFFKEGEKPTYGQLTEFYIYHVVLTMIYLVMSILRMFQYLSNRIKLRFLSVAFNSAEDPEIINNDVNKLAKIPRRVSAILNYKPEQEENGGVEGLCNDAAKVATWCLSSGIANLFVYEYHGVLKKRVPALRRAIYKKFVAYFGTQNVPNFVIKIPHLNLSYPGSVDGKLVEDDGEILSNGNSPKYNIEITLLSVTDGRPTIVELTKVMADLAKKGELRPKDITLKFMDQELQQLVGKEPDLVIMFQPFLNLQGYPPWQIRLSELYWEPDNDSIGYAVFLRALQKYSTCKINVGR
ncbi:DEKNAAC105056 [Brettanomyces naardenensis]|uniref:ditrans,polycis-polyprenyl diphosphate synthase [(2E,6E)-farnesyldiphosphate specific] n=1 Tax=Brettanomyces naardenensis TaxID=13370 RepID=A0A448YSH1_BRENA|nr:DEKNAAC105056 [Brettanomyces naardenensis]